MSLQFPTDINNPNSSNNPLTALEDDGYSVKNFTYPIDLTNDPGENHMIVFYINESYNTQFITNGSGQSKFQNGVQVSKSPTGTSRYNNSQGLFTGPAPDNTPGIQSQSNITTYNLTPINRVSTCIAMYIPPVVQTSYQTDWGTVEFGATGGALKALFNQNGTDILKAVGEGAIGTLSNALESINAGLKNKAGIDFDAEAATSVAARVVRNPNVEMLFRSVGFRQCQFDFKFTPRSEQEGLNVSNIIKAFKFYSAPEVRDAQNTPRYFIWPAEFDIEFWSNGRLNNFLNKISTCACTEVSVNYTGSGGWSAMRPGLINGMSVETNLTLKFQELEIITKNRILQGF